MMGRKIDDEFILAWVVIFLSTWEQALELCFCLFFVFRSFGYLSWTSGYEPSRSSGDLHSLLNTLS
jgi:hypothetical protein